MTINRILPVSDPVFGNHFDDNTFSEKVITNIIKGALDVPSYLIKFKDEGTYYELQAMLDGYLVNCTVFEDDVKQFLDMHLVLSVDSTTNILAKTPVSVTSSVSDGAVSLYVATRPGTDKRFTAVKTAYYHVNPTSINVKNVVINCGTATSLIS